MSNMGYCRFENTASDLRDCVDHWDDNLSESEARARVRILRMAAEIFENCGIAFDDDDYGFAISTIGETL